MVLIPLVPRWFPVPGTTRFAACTVSSYVLPHTSLTRVFVFKEGAVAVGRGGARQGAGRPGQKPNAGHLLVLDVREIHRMPVLVEPDGGMFLCHGAKFFYTFDGAVLGITYARRGLTHCQEILVERTSCRFGGSRPWLQCPKCEQRALILYTLGETFTCRRCARFTYSSQREDAMARSWRRQRSISRRLGPGTSKPKGMHWATYWRLMDQIRECEHQRNLITIAWGQAMFANLTRRFQTNRTPNGRHEP